MPSNSHLSWAEIEDFSPGLWTASPWLMPASAAQQMDNCYPQPGGGLRAFFKPTSFTGTGLTPASQVVTGLFLLGGLLHRTVQTGQALDRYLMTRDPSTRVTRLFRKDETNSDVAWSLLKAFAAGSASFDLGRQAVFAPYYTTVDGLTICVTNGEAGSADAGLWKFNYSDGVGTKLTAAGGTVPLDVPATFQARLIALDGLSPQTASKIWYSDPGAITFPAANFINLEPSDTDSTNAFLVPFPPSDLLVGKRGGQTVVVQGEITDPVVRATGKSLVYGETQVVTTAPTGGVVVQASEDGVYLTAMGESFERLSDQLNLAADLKVPTTHNTLGSLLYLNNLLFVPKGYVHDWRTKSWFRATDFTTVQHMTLNRTSRQESDAGGVKRSQIMAATGGLDFTLMEMETFEGATRYNTYTWKSAPFRAEDGRQLEIREVQVYLRSNDTGAQCAVTVGSSTRTVTGLNAGNHQVTFLFRERGETLDVRVVPTAGNAANEAPSVEVVRVGQGSGHLLR